MSYDNFNQGGRPGFTEQTNTYEQSNNQAPQQNSYGNNQGGNSSGYSGGDRSGYGGNSGNSGGYNGNSNRSGYDSSSNNRGSYGGGGGGGYKGNGGGGGGWKGNKGGFQKQTLTPEQLAALELPKRSIVLAGNYGAPDNLVPVIREIADIIRNANFTIRASSMDGFDKMVVDNVRDAEFHIPWKDFGGVSNAKSSFNSDQCKEFAKRYLPDWNGLKETHQAFWAKNVRLVLGKNLDAHCHAAIVWSDDGVEGPSNRGQRSAHAGHIAAICHACGIPVINISNPNAVQRLRNLIEGQKHHG